MTTMRMAVAKNQFGLTPDTSELKRVGQTIGVEARAIGAYSHDFKSMTFGDITLHNPDILVSPIDSGEHVIGTGSHIKSDRLNAEDLLIGMNFMKKFRLVIAYSENALYYTVAAPKQAASQ